MKKLMVGLTALSILTLAACTKVESVEYYKEHPDKAEKVFAKCEEKGEKMNEKEQQNCKNAIKGYMSVKMGAIMGDAGLQ